MPFGDEGFDDLTGPPTTSAAARALVDYPKIIGFKSALFVGASHHCDDRVTESDFPCVRALVAA